MPPETWSLGPFSPRSPTRRHFATLYVSLVRASTQLVEKSRGDRRLGVGSAATDGRLPVGTGDKSSSYSGFLGAGYGAPSGAFRPGLRAAGCVTQRIRANPRQSKNFPALAAQESRKYRLVFLLVGETSGWPPLAAASSTSTWTRSTRPWSSAMTPASGAGQWPSAARPSPAA